MAGATAEAPKPNKPPKPETLKRPVRRQVKRYGKRLTRWVAAYQSRQSLIPDTPVPSRRSWFQADWGSSVSAPSERTTREKPLPSL